ncbi:15460_t:CDS:1, partial [Funneliformis mosseae]
KEYRIFDSAVSEFLKKSEHWFSINTTLSNANNFHKKLSNFSQIKEIISISIWVDQQISRSLILSRPIIQEKAKEFAILFDINSFSASGG